jgi:hypothetical protein
MSLRERTRLACWLRRLAETTFSEGDWKLSVLRRRAVRQHARGVRSPDTDRVPFPGQLRKNHIR